MKGLAGIVYREVRLYTQSRLNLALSLATPVLYAFLLGGTLERSLGQVTYGGEQLAYSAFAVPGYSILALLTSSMSNSQSVFQERDSGMLLEIMSCAVGPATYVVGKFLGTTIIGSCYGILMFISMSVTHSLHWGLPRLLMVLVVLPLVCLLISSLYLVVCSLAKTLQTFLIVMNLLSMVLIFTSTIFYPPASLPGLLQLLSAMNPVSIGCALMRVVVLSPSSDWASALLGASLVTIASACIAGYLLSKRLADL